MTLDLITHKNDLWKTPVYAVRPLVNYLRKFSRYINKSIMSNSCKIWCPFDTEDSYYVKLFRKEGFEVLCTHIDNGEDFFELANKKFIAQNNIDIIISNIPFSIKTEILERLFELNKPFAVLTNIAGLFDSQKRFKMFRENDFEIMFFNKRISYLDSYEDDNTSANPPFLSVYVCHNFLQKPRVFEEIEKKEIHLK